MVAKAAFVLDKCSKDLSLLWKALPKVKTNGKTTATEIKVKSKLNLKSYLYESQVATNDIIIEIKSIKMKFTYLLLACSLLVSSTDASIGSQTAHQQAKEEHLIKNINER